MNGQEKEKDDQMAGTEWIRLYRKTMNEIEELSDRLKTAWDDLAGVRYQKKLTRLLEQMEECRKRLESGRDCEES